MIANVNSTIGKLVSKLHVTFFQLTIVSQNVLSKGFPQYM